MSTLNWFTELQWSTPIAVEVLRYERHRIPSAPGVYAFTNYPAPLVAGMEVLYVGKANSLRTRLPAYLKDPEGVTVQSVRSKSSPWNTSLRHPGAALMLMEVQAKYRNTGTDHTYVWARWTETPDALALESKLLMPLRPKYCCRGVPK